MKRQGNRMSILISEEVASCTVAGVLTAGANYHQGLRQRMAGARRHGDAGSRKSGSGPFLPNELWIHSGDRIRWTFPAHERDIRTLLRATWLGAASCLWPDLRCTSGMSKRWDHS